MSDQPAGSSTLVAEPPAPSPVAPRSTFDFVVVANRLPVEWVTGGDGGGWQTSPGGLVAAVAPVLRERHGVWVGWPGRTDDHAPPLEVAGLDLAPVDLSAEQVELFYEGFANATIWPLYHDVIAPPEFHRTTWESYRQVNSVFADAAAAVAAPGAVVWVHDYQLQLMPAMLRARRPDLRIGYFNHIPFPPYEIFAQLPWRRQIVNGLLGADHLGFQRVQDANNFLRASRRALGLSTRAGAVSLPGGPTPRLVTARAHPISIDVPGWDAALAGPEVVSARARLRAELGERRVLLGADRLDYTKGILHRLRAYEELLREGRVDPAEVVFVQVASPTRERVEAYARTRDEVDLIVGRINGEHASIGKPAVHYVRLTLGRSELVALYQLADVMLVTPLRDGMNLIAKEYVVSRTDSRGVLVLSEFTGAADELRQAVLVNPHDIDGLKDAIVRALGMPPAEQARRMRFLRTQVRHHDVHAWAEGFLAALAPPATDPGLSLPAPSTEEHR